VSTHTDTSAPPSQDRSELDCRAINLFGHLFLAAVWAEREVARRLKAQSRAWARPRSRRAGLGPAHLWPVV